MLDATKEPFNQVPLAVQEGIMRPTALLVTLMRDNWLNTSATKGCSEGFGPISFVCNQLFGPNVRASAFTRPDGPLLHQGVSHGDIMSLARREAQRKQSSIAINTGMDFGGQPTSAAP